MTYVTIRQLVRRHGSPAPSIIQQTCRSQGNVITFIVFHMSHSSVPAFAEPLTRLTETFRRDRLPDFGNVVGEGIHHKLKF
jgi:hypothetical protein